MLSESVAGCYRNQWPDVPGIRIHIYEKYIIEITGNQKRFSRAFLEEMFPKADVTKPVYHYTSISALEGIAKSGEFHLHSVEKRLGQGELDEFARDHKLNGYLESPDQTPFFKELAKDLFYTSFTRSEKSNEQCWNDFTDRGKGVRLKVLLEPKQCEMRPIHYSQSARTLLVRLNKALEQDGLPVFVPWTISMIGAFYLSSCWQHEDEIWLLVKRHHEGRDEAQTCGAYQYWPLPIGDGDICKIQIEEIKAGPQANLSDIQSAIDSTAFAHLPLC